MTGSDARIRVAPNHSRAGRFRESMPPEALLAGYPQTIGAIAERLRRLVREAEPTAIERVRSGWRLIGYDLPVGRRSAYFAFVWPEPEHVHLGFPNGVFMDDPDRVMLGAGIVRQARWLTYTSLEAIDVPLGAALVREAA